MTETRVRPLIRRALRGPALLVIGLICLYQLTAGRLVGTRCRFHPTCSQYAIEAISANGLLRGGAASAWRIVRCAPWSAGGLDPVKIRRRPEVTARG